MVGDRGQPGSPLDLFDVLAAALLRKEALPELCNGVTSAKALAATLRDDPRGVQSAVVAGLSLAADGRRRELSIDQPPVARLALLVDQLEEMFTLAHVTPDDRRKFVDALAVLARGGHAYVIATLRADFLTRCSELPVLIALRSGDALYELPPPSLEEVGQMIRKPAAVAGLRFEERAGRGALDDVLRDEASSAPENLPYLEYTLLKLYDLRTKNLLTFDAFDKLGGITGALAQGAEVTFKTLSKKSQKALPFVALALDQGRRRG